MAYVMCAVGCEQYMRENARQDEIATMVAENNNETKKFVKGAHALLRGEHKYADVIFRAISNDRKNLPIKKIKDTVHFAEKQEAVFLQLADAFGFVFRRFLEGQRGQYELFTELLFEPEKYLSLMEKEAGCQIVKQKPNPEVIPEYFSTIPGNPEILPFLKLGGD